MEGIQTFKGSWPWPWPWIWLYGIPSCITHRPLPIHKISFKSNKLFVDGRTYGRTDIFTPLILLGRILEVDLKKVNWRRSKHRVDAWTQSARDRRISRPADHCKPKFNAVHGDAWTKLDVTRHCTMVICRDWRNYTGLQHAAVVHCRHLRQLPDFRPCQTPGLRV